VTDTYGSLCSGIGGFDLAIEAVFGYTQAWHAEIESAPAQVHERHWPGVPNLGDITTVDWAMLPPVDMICAGYPCQPFSTAGRRLGVNDPRHLWPHISHAISVLRPGIVVLENVPGHRSLGFDVVLGSLAEAGYDAEWCSVRASDIGAPHRRERLFVIASDASGARRAGAENPGTGRGHESSHRSRSKESQRGSTLLTADPDSAARGRSGSASETLREPGTVQRLGRRDQVAWGKFEPAIRRWERIISRPAPHPVDDRGLLSPALVEWMMGYPQDWTEGAKRTQRLKMLGNAVVPAQAEYAIRVLTAPLPS